MRILIAGANGQIGRHVVDRMVAGGHKVRGGVRSPDQVSVINDKGAQGVLLDLTKPELFAAELEDTDAVIFAAGSGGKAVEAVDRDGAISLIDATKKANIARFVMLSSVSADTPELGPEKLRPYLRAKGAADDHLKESGLDYTIVRPVTLTNDKPTGRIVMGDGIDVKNATISRADVAHVLDSALTRTQTIKETFVIASGESLIDEALRTEVLAD
jgi:uncharacterized protein YbjT (DUF2867 family)